MSNLGWKVTSILAVLVIFGALGVYPILASRFGVHSPGWLMDKQLKLGLDLKGGGHLVLRVETDEALKAETEHEMGRLGEAIQKAGINAKVAQPDATHFRVDGVTPDKDGAFRDAAN